MLVSKDIKIVTVIVRVVDNVYNNATYCTITYYDTCVNAPIVDNPLIIVLIRQ